ncbi:SPOR domain-containing protein [Subsaxibacter sp. CAU 1640]|uniref:SPOR domain-containing protein n=1 Tax=Subsaxibacter sp. CAU 1640 TaxID=2933271 RepID=UPI00200570A8|nr:SPOR domain-containing protein [Subsaxibacter sp. CAU 1640]MCK7589782.1 SPOR domain-containing protein [Subsaxibacter sp. CAU 1640]
MKKSVFKPLFICLIFTSFSFVTQAQTGLVSIDANKDIDKLLEYKKDIKTIDLYKIRVYSGDRSGAENTKSKASSLYSDWPILMEYETPNYKIYVGNFLSRLEADRALLTVKKNYPSALILFFKKEKNKL